LESLAFEFVEDYKHPQFKNLLSIVKERCVHPEAKEAIEHKEKKPYIEIEESKGIIK